MNKCLYCGKEITSKRRGTLFCTDKSTCRVMYRRRELEAEKKRGELKGESDLKAKIAALSKFAPATAEKLHDFTDQHGVDCSSAAVSLCLTAFTEVQTRHKDNQPQA